MWPPHSATGWNSFRHETPEQSRELENVTRISIHKVVSYKWVKYNLWVNNPFRFSLHMLYKLLWNATPCKLASNLSVIGAIWEAKIKSAPYGDVVSAITFTVPLTSQASNVQHRCLFHSSDISRPVTTPACQRWFGQIFLLNHGSKKWAAAVVFFSL